MLKRATKPKHDVLVELARAAAPRLVCDACHAVGLNVSTLDSQDDVDWPEARLCEVCRAPIPAERLEAIPSATRCVACQEGGRGADEHQAAQFCEHCGGLLTIRLSRGRRTAQYKMVCSDCGR